MRCPYFPACLGQVEILVKCYQSSTDNFDRIVFYYFRNSNFKVTVDGKDL